jgi:hypothetical protein
LIAAIFCRRSRCDVATFDDSFFTFTLLIERIMNTAANQLGNSNTQNVFAQPLLADASLLGGNVSLGITTQPSNPLALSNPLAFPNPATSTNPIAPATTPNNFFTPQAFQPGMPLFPAANNNVASSLPISGNPNIDPLTGSPLLTPLSTPVAANIAPPPPPIPNFSIMAEGKININGGGDLDGLPLDPTDDALIYAGQGFDIKGNITLPTQRDAAGNILKDASNRSLLVNNAVTVADSP